VNELPSGWTTATLGEICHKPKYGWTTSATASRPAVFKLLRTSDMSKRSLDWNEVPYASAIPAEPADFTVCKGDIFISRAGANAGVTVLIETQPPKALFASYLIRLRPKLPSTELFLKYFLQSAHYWNQILRSRLGIAQPNINATKLAELSVPLPPLAEQRRIVAEIEKHFTRLDEAERMTAQARTRARAFRRSAIRNTCAPFSSRKHVPFGQLITSLRNGISEKPTAASGFPILKISAVRPFRLHLPERRYLADASLHEGFELKENDLLFTRYNGNPQLVGVCARVPVLNETLYYPDKLIRARLPTGHDARFYELMFNGGKASEHIRSRVRTTAGQSGISGADIKSAPVPVVTGEEQTAAADLFEQTLLYSDRVDSELKALITRTPHLRQAILAKAFSGQLVPQDPNDEPASVLLERIRAERDREIAGPLKSRRTRLRTRQAALQSK